MRPCLGLHVLVSCCGLCVWCRLRIDAIVRYILLLQYESISQITNKTMNQRLSPTLLCLACNELSVIDYRIMIGVSGNPPTSHGGRLVPTGSGFSDQGKWDPTLWDQVTRHVDGRFRKSNGGVETFPTGRKD
jgi:hypothetical protein